MLVNSINFWIFFLVVLLLYYGVRQTKWQNGVLLLASYFFYGWMSVPMTVLLVMITAVFYGLGRWSAGRHKPFVVVGALLGVGMLLYFKYTNFIFGEIASCFRLLGLHVSWSALKIVVPVGVSFFIFKLISYLVDVYKGKLSPVQDPVAFAAWVAFFPTIMSGPIDRAVDTAPQLQKARKWDNVSALEGGKRILWGMFLKMCIADKVSPYTDAVFGNYFHHSGLTLMVAAVLYTFQIYADFAGYSEMAIGVARFLGIRVTENFHHPYLSLNMGEFWRRWHMSLMSWFRDYVYFPLGGSRCSQLRIFRNTVIVFAVSGLWHGANWTFICWGLYHAALVYGYRLYRESGFKTYLDNLNGWIRPNGVLRRLLCVGCVFVLSVFGWMIFRAPSLEQFLHILGRLSAPGVFFKSWALTAIVPIAVLCFKDVKDEAGWNIHFLHNSKWWVQAISIAFLLVYVLYTGELDGAQFIYFQF